MGHKPMETPESYDLFLRRKYLLLLTLLAILAAAVLFALTTGSSGMSLGQVVGTYGCPGRPPPWWWAPPWPSPGA